MHMPRLLLVEDNEESRDGLSRHLRRKGYEVLIAVDGRQALVAGLYWGQRVLIPLALAVLLTFVLAPPVSLLERRGLGRVPAVLVVVGLAAALLGLVGWLVAAQLTALVNDLPGYKEAVRARV